MIAEARMFFSNIVELLLLHDFTKTSHTPSILVDVAKKC